MNEIIEEVCMVLKKAIKTIKKMPHSELRKTKFYVRDFGIDDDVLPMHKSLFSVAKYNRNGDVIIRGKSSVEKKK